MFVLTLLLILFLQKIIDIFKMVDSLKSPLKKGIDMKYTHTQRPFTQAFKSQAITKHLGNFVEDFLSSFTPYETMKENEKAINFINSHKDLMISNPKQPHETPKKPPRDKEQTPSKKKETANQSINQDFELSIEPTQLDLEFTSSKSNPKNKETLTHQTLEPRDDIPIKRKEVRQRKTFNVEDMVNVEKNLRTKMDLKQHLKDKFPYGNIYCQSLIRKKRFKLANLETSLKAYCSSNENLFKRHLRLNFKEQPTLI